jgi:hypothetical protein
MTKMGFIACPENDPKYGPPVLSGRLPSGYELATLPDAWIIT